MSKVPSKEWYRSEEWYALRATVLKRDNYICSYCGGPANSADHIKPRSKGGSDTLDNLVAVCHGPNSCNEFLSARDFNTFAEKFAYYKAYSPLRDKRREGKRRLEIELEKLKWQKASTVITPDERRRIKRKLVNEGYFFRFRLHKYFCRHCHSTSKKGARWPSTACCPWCFKELERELGEGVPYSYDAAVNLRRNTLLANPKNFHCKLCDAISENSKVCRHCVPF
jgi:5-methylcytosine-specific restriction endonuclease McrA